MDSIMPLRGLVAFVDRALNLQAAARNAGRAAADLSRQVRERERIARTLPALFEQDPLEQDRR